MENFVAYNPTKLIFGKKCIEKLGAEASKFGKRALILIGKGSVKKNGILDSVYQQLQQAGIEYTLYEGIKSNPVYQEADAAVAQAKEFNTDMIIAVGGGSVIDTAKGIAMGYYVEHSVWDFYIRKAKGPEKALPILDVLTLAATGTEMNMFTVLQNNETNQKNGYGHPLLYPKVSFLDPEYTYSVPKDYTAYGVADLISHCLELYFDKSDSPLSDYYATDIIRLAFDYGRKVLAEPENYDARANIMWLATNALNGTLNAGKMGGDWGVHGIEHNLSVLFDIAHGAGLSIVYPAWLKAFQPEIEQKLDFLAKRIVGEQAKGQDFIEALEKFYTEISTPIRLSQAGIKTDEQKNMILETLKKNKSNGSFFKMDEQAYEKILSLMS